MTSQYIYQIEGNFLFFFYTLFCEIEALRVEVIINARHQIDNVEALSNESSDY